MTELCAVSLATGRVLSIPGQPWTVEPPAEVNALRREVCRQMRALDALLREIGLAGRLLPVAEAVPGAVCAMGSTAYC